MVACGLGSSLRPGYGTRDSLRVTEFHRVDAFHLEDRSQTRDIHLYSHNGVDVGWSDRPYNYPFHNATRTRMMEIGMMETRMIDTGIMDARMTRIDMMEMRVMEIGKTDTRLGRGVI